MTVKPPKRMFPGRERPEPELPGPQGLQQWVSNFPAHWASAYRSALKLGHESDIVISATPHNDRVTTAPQGFAVMTRQEAIRLVPKLAVSLMKPAPDGFFYTMPTKRFGRLKGSCLGILNKPKDDKELPAVAIIVNDEGAGVVV
jgi:hypothetical protein